MIDRQVLADIHERARKVKCYLDTDGVRADYVAMLRADVIVLLSYVATLESRLPREAA